MAATTEATSSWKSNDAGTTVVYGQECVAKELLGMVKVAANKEGALRIVVVCAPSKRSTAQANQIVASAGLSSVCSVTLCAKAVQHCPQSAIDVAWTEDVAAGTDCLVAIGGGSSIGLAKALSLRVEQGIPVIAIPTTYSGSEMTNIVGITAADGNKHTSREARARPRVVLYDPSLTTSIPLELSIKSAFNAMAHAVEALWDPKLAPTSKLLAEQGIKELANGLGLACAAKSTTDKKELLADKAFRAYLMYGSYLCGSALNAAAMGIQHKLSHVVAGSFGLDHADVHTALLPHSIEYNRSHAGPALDRIARALGVADAASGLYALQRDVGVKTSLRQIGFTRGDIEKATALAISKPYANPRPIEENAIRELLEDAYHGRPPSPLTHRTNKIVEGASGDHANLRGAACGAELAAADVVVVCVHGRFASSDRILQMCEDAIGVQDDKTRVALIAPQALDAQWYDASFLITAKDLEPKLSSALSAVHAAVAYASQFVAPSKIVLFGFSQGACLALSYAASATALPVGAIAACSGGLIGSDSEVVSGGLYSACPALKGTRVFLNCAEKDDHVPLSRVQASAKVLRAVGASVEELYFPGSTHAITQHGQSALRIMVQQAKASARNDDDPYSYLSGYGNCQESEALPGAVPRSSRHPRDLPYGLVTEQFNGSPFCAPRTAEGGTWFYRIQASVWGHGAFTKRPHPTLRGDFCCPGNSFTPEVVRWKPPPHPKDNSSGKKDFVEGLVTIAGTGNPMTSKGLAIHTYSCNQDMLDKSFYNSDGDLLIVPEFGALDIQTECGRLRVKPCEAFILPRGLKMTVTLPEKSKGSRGWVAELFETGHLILPNRGPLGSHGLASQRNFKVPVAAYEDRKCENYTLISKFGGELFEASLQYSPYDVVGWSGHSYPCKYNLMDFVSFGSVSRDHGDPSTHTVLTYPINDKLGASALDFVCFKGRWDAVKDTFRPPYYHRNCASEFNGILKIDQPYAGFDQGVSWLTPVMTAHGIAGQSYSGFKSLDSAKANTPMYLSDDSVWIMFESCYPMILTEFGHNAANRDHDYRAFFSGATRAFTGPSQGSQ